ncbi:replication endonuclease [Pragia fontium]|uniref:Bacteriophage replication gene A protein (GPA) n=1 Tax=Pragia fontium DSM 5563 = ATCC 49100 TaxID=1122977 RepID=A0AAJ5BGL8_9GAMM|nr:replication endonuclease [Pragia fontium]SFC49082.1 Bacteriophage replication gene A protein (GPA) [Pragia fontium DSM 5563 = ATCC 49100]
MKIAEIKTLRGYRSPASREAVINVWHEYYEQYGRWPWNTDKQQPLPLPPKQTAVTPEMLAAVAQAQRDIEKQPLFIKMVFSGRYDYLVKNAGSDRANKYLLNTFSKRVLPRLHLVNNKHHFASNDDSARVFREELNEFSERFNRIHSLSVSEVDRLAYQIAYRINGEFTILCDHLVGDEGPEILSTPDVLEMLYRLFAGAARSFHVTPLFWAKYLRGKLQPTDAAASIARLVNPDWWRRKLRTRRTHWREHLYIAAGQVNKNISPYLSKSGYRDWQTQRHANMEYLRSHELEDVETGERISLIDKVLHSVANPAIRRHELMNAMAGIEKAAIEMGCVGVFYTLTAPSKYHPSGVKKKGRSGIQFNRNWSAAAYTPKETQQYLAHIWQLMRTALKDAGLRVFGYRVAEPHHDGTPHWHMLFFMPPEHRAAITQIFRNYALLEDGDEPGAQKYRFTEKIIDPAKGSATGYIAKYISKNIDGYAMEGEIDEETGKPMKERAASVAAWASTWRIRQFQPVGIPPIGVWRELRSIGETSIAEQFDESVDAVRLAAHSSNFAAYIMAQGGAFTPRRDLVVRVASKVADELNPYGEEVQKTTGVYSPYHGTDKVYCTRKTKWKIVPKSLALDPLTLQSEAPRSSVNNCGNGVFVDEPELPPEPRAIDWSNAPQVRAMVFKLKKETPKKHHYRFDWDKSPPKERRGLAILSDQAIDAIPQIENFTDRIGIEAEPWTLEALARGARVDFGDDYVYQVTGDRLNMISLAPVQVNEKRQITKEYLLNRIAVIRHSHG